jgi:hypothetical protein
MTAWSPSTPAISGPWWSVPRRSITGVHTVPLAPLDDLPIRSGRSLLFDRADGSIADVKATPPVRGLSHVPASSCPYGGMNA